jgi:alkaline phosphatase D
MQVSLTVSKKLAKQVRQSMQVLLFFLLFSLGAVRAQYQSNYDKLSQIKNLTRIAIASCNDQKRKQTVWKDLLREAPELFIWGGDNVYADTKIPS